MVRGERTVLTKANDKSYSLRTTVPTGVRSHLDLKEGDHLLWNLTPTKNGNGFMVTVEPEVAPPSKKDGKAKKKL